MIRLQNVCKSYRTPFGRRVVLHDACLALPEGCSLGILGANGVGKSTLIRLIAGTEAPEAGRITRDRRRMSFPLGFGGTLHPKLSGRENAVFLARLYGADERDAVAFVEDFAELGRYFRMPVETYSSGMRARLAFGACLAIQFDVYLIDEVTSVGDARFRARCGSTSRRCQDAWWVGWPLPRARTTWGCVWRQVPFPGFRPPASHRCQLKAAGCDVAPLRDLPSVG